MHDGVGPSGVIGGVSQRGVSSWLAQGTFIGSSDGVHIGPSGVVGGVRQRGVSLWLTQDVFAGYSSLSTWHALDLLAYAIELSDHLWS